MKFGPVFRPLVPGLGTLMLNLQALVSFIPPVLSSLSGLARHPHPGKSRACPRGSSAEAAYLFACSLRKAGMARGLAWTERLVVSV
jgi:hypothetical protein